MHEVLVNRLGGPSLPRKSVVRLTDRPDMTLDVYRGRKTTKQPTKNRMAEASLIYKLGHQCPTVIHLSALTKNEDTKSPNWLNQGNGNTLLITVWHKKSYLWIMLIRCIFSRVVFCAPATKWGGAYSFTLVFLFVVHHIFSSAVFEESVEVLS